MNCPICNAWTQTNDTRNKGDRMVRRRECGNGHRFNTEERVVVKKRKAEKDANRNMAPSAAR